MQQRVRIPSPGFFGLTALWTGGLVALAMVNQVAWDILRTGSLHLAELLSQVPAWIGLVLPFVVFAGGLAAAGLSTSSVAKRAVLLALLSYGLLAYASPMAQYRAWASAGVDVAALHPFGPETPGGIRARRSAVEADPPEVFSFRTSRPLERPPNWLTYLLHSSIALAGFAVLSALLGQRARMLTTGLSPPWRRLAHWALGLASGALFFGVVLGGGEWVRAHPSRSGMLGAWLPLLVPLVTLAVLEIQRRTRGRRYRGKGGA